MLGKIFTAICLTCIICTNQTYRLPWTVSGSWSGKESILRRKVKAPKSKGYMDAIHALHTSVGPGGAYLPLLASRPGRKRSKYGPEGLQQLALVQWARLKGLLLISIPNSAKRTAWGGEREKALGLHPGASDLLLINAWGGYGGFFIEMKAPGKRPRPDQYQFLERVRTLGYASDWYDNWEIASWSIENYLAGSFKNPPLR